VVRESSPTPGGFNPRALAEDIHEYASSRGVALSVAYVLGDNLLDCFPDLVAAGHRFTNMDTGKMISDASYLDPISVNAYLGGWGIAKALAEGTQIVITGRVADASLVVGSAAWFHGWRDNEWDKLAGALAAAHITECAPQAVGGNFSGFDTLEDARPLSFPIAEIHEDGTAVIGSIRGRTGKSRSTP
jgi:Acyclic terpene utilisation family protein AtuA